VFRLGLPVLRDVDPAHDVAVGVGLQRLEDNPVRLGQWAEGDVELSELAGL
jgi:hypothetical protein